jgi:aryl-alcohol dehydrogenase-like predicted oxidoreductase
MAVDGISATAAGELALGDLTVRRMGFGAMRVTGDGIWGEPADRDGAIALLRRLVDLDVNLIDTADSYGPDVSENLIAEALHPYPENLVIATKGGLTREGPGSWGIDAHPERLKSTCEGSLRRLKVDTIDVYQLHSPDPKVPFEESVGALAELREQGKIRHVGLSNVGVDQAAQRGSAEDGIAQVERAREMVPVVSVQNRYSLTKPRVEGLIDHCEREGIGFIPWSPIDWGELADAEGLKAIADAHDATTTQVAIAWLLQRSPVMLPIPGTASMAHLEENVAAASLRLSEDELARARAAARGG